MGYLKYRYCSFIWVRVRTSAEKCTRVQVWALQLYSCSQVIFHEVEYEYRKIYLSTSMSMNTSILHSGVCKDCILLYNYNNKLVDKFGWTKKKFTKAELEPATSGLTCRGSTTKLFLCSALHIDSVPMRFTFNTLFPLVTRPMSFL